MRVVLHDAGSRWPRTDSRIASDQEATRKAQSNPNMETITQQSKWQATHSGDVSCDIVEYSRIKILSDLLPPSRTQGREPDLFDLHKTYLVAVNISMKCQFSNLFRVAILGRKILWASMSAVSHHRTVMILFESLRKTTTWSDKWNGL